MRRWGLRLLVVALAVLVVGVVAYRPPLTPMCSFHGWSLVHRTARAHPAWPFPKLWEVAHRCDKRRA
jgi:hypothetical protein